MLAFSHDSLELLAVFFVSLRLFGCWAAELGLARRDLMRERRQLRKAH